MATNRADESLGIRCYWSETSLEIRDGKVIHSITENFGIGADSLDESEFDLEDEEEQQDDIEDQNAAIIRFVNEVIQKAIVDRANRYTFRTAQRDLAKIRRIDGQLVPVRVPDNLRTFQMRSFQGSKS